MAVFLNGLATAVPEYELPQTLVEDNARRILGSRYAQFERMSASFKTSGVEKRYSFAPIDWFQEPKGWEDRNTLYLEGAKEIFIKVANQALTQANLKASEIDTVVTVSSTGIATPTIEALAFKAMGFRNDVRRVPLFGLGCAGGVSGLGIAQTLASAEPGTNVLLVVIEACTLSFRSDRLQKADIIATILFGDGAAAAVLSTDQKSDIKLHKGSEHLWPDTLGIMGWDVDNTGFGVVFDRSIPAFAQEHMAQAVSTAGQKAKFEPHEISRYVFHPGGAKVVEAIETALELQTGTLDCEREILKDYGNMSAPTALFVLKNVLAQGTKGKLMMGALGPGFTASFMPLEVS
jgi:alkylresorcinol/alkylpyrone synthase